MGFEIVPPQGGFLTKNKIMNWKKTDYKVIITSDDKFQVCKVTSYLGLSWCMEYVGDYCQDIFEARTLIKMILDNNIEVKYL